MAVDLHTGDTELPYYQFLHDNKQGKHDLLNHSNNINGSSPLKPKLMIPHQMQMAHLMMLQDDDDKFDFSSIGSQNLESPLDSINWAQSTLWSPLCSNQGSPEGSSPKEPSPSSAKSLDSCWESTYKMLEKMKLDEKGSSKYHPSHGIQTSDTSDVGVCSYPSLLEEQIRAIHLSRLRQEQILSLKPKLTEYGENHGQFQKKGKGIVDVGFGNRRRTHSPHQQIGSEIQALFPGNPGSRGTPCGTGVFLPRGRRTCVPSESHKKTGKGCSTVLIPARVVQALQIHFDQIAATSGPKIGAFPPLHDVLVSNRDGMYSLQKRRSRKKPPHIQNEVILPREWAY